MKGNAWRCGIHENTPDTVTIEGETDWQGLQVISTALGEALQVKVKMVVPPDKAKTVYDILKPKEG